MNAVVPLRQVTWTRLYDPNRTPSHWTEIIQPGEYSVFVLTAATRSPRDPEGGCFPSGEEAVAICINLDQAEKLANEVVARHPELCAEVYDHRGKSGEPLRVIYES